jgi:hypothetical protein
MRHFLDHSLQPDRPRPSDAAPSPLSSTSSIHFSRTKPSIHFLSHRQRRPQQSRRRSPEHACIQDAVDGPSIWPDRLARVVTRTRRPGNPPATGSPFRPPRRPRHAQPPIPRHTSPLCANPSSRRRIWRRRVCSCTGAAAFRPAAPLLVAALRLAAWPAIEMEDLIHGIRVQLTRLLRGKLPI